MLVLYTAFGILPICPILRRDFVDVRVYRTCNWAAIHNPDRRVKEKTETEVTALLPAISFVLAAPPVYLILPHAI